jgi:hypothetical protein
VKLRRIAIAISALTVGTASVLIPSGASAGVTRHSYSTWRLNGASYRAPVFVNCAPGAARGTPLAKNLIATSAKRDIKFTVTFLADRKHPIVLAGTRKTALPKSLSLPCSGTGQVRYRVERVLPRRTTIKRAFGGIPVVTAMASFAAPAPRRTQLIRQSIVPVVFVQTAS